MKNKKGINLLGRYLKGKATLEEQAAVNNWYHSADDRDSCKDEEELLNVENSLFHRIWDQIGANGKVLPFYKRSSFRIAAAVVVLMGLWGIYYAMSSGKTGTHSSAVSYQKLEHDVAAPGINRATLTLSDGSSIVLDSTGTGRLAQQGNMEISKTADDKIVYQSGGRGDASVRYNTLSVPKGSRPMMLMLADGSKVWLDVASSITYPTVFTGNERKVQVTGEVYFEVAALYEVKNGKAANKKKIPFAVSVHSSRENAREAEVHVLGTHFNVNAYDEEKALKVSLFEGSVRVEGAATKPVYLRPNQQAVLNENGKIEVKNNIDPDEVMAWKDNWFNFNSLTIDEIMRQIGRWYDVSVYYKNHYDDKHFSGIVSRNKNVSEVLRIMEQAGIKFYIEGRNITVM